MSLTDLAAELPQVSFRLGGAPSNDFLEGWGVQTSSEEAPGGSLTHITHTDPESGLAVTVHVRRFDDFPAIDWVVELENRGGGDTPIIEEIEALDVSIPVPTEECLRLHHAKGSACRVDDFLPLTTDLLPESRTKLAPIGGRSSNGTLPFMNLQGDGCGVVLAIGWSGQWAASFERGQDALRLAVGMERTHLRLHPGERIRTPRILSLVWRGDDPALGNNLLRRLLLAHYVPRIDGQLVTPPAAQCLQAHYYLTGNAGEPYEMKALPKAAAVGAEAYWIDACWYGTEAEWWEAVGHWEVNRERFPNGLKPISDAAHDAGMAFVLWFEPERVRPRAQFRREHPEFLLASAADSTNLLVNLGDPDARRHFTDVVSRLISENGVDIYRQDCNIDPLLYWQGADAPDRIGMTEIRHVEGLYEFWDELRRRHPRLWIDNCASGGRRIDLETVSRSLPLWPSDFPDVIGLPYGAGLHVGDQCINAGLARWIPFFGGGVWNFTPYSTRGEIIGGFTFGFHIDAGGFPSDAPAHAVTHSDVLAKGTTLLDDDFPMDAARAAIKEWTSIREFFVGDFFLLLPLTVSYHDWCAWQFHREDLESGIAMFFRRHRSPFPTMQVALNRIVRDAEYEVSESGEYEEAPRRRMSGRDLARFSVTIGDQPGSVLLRYAKVT